MTFRERYLETLLFGAPDRIPFMPGGPRESTLRAWRAQGLPADANWYDVLLKEIGLPKMEGGLEWAGVSFQMIPIFEEKVLEHKDGHYIVRDWMGAITEISDEFDYTYIRAAKDFVTRKWHKFPVETREDWEAMKERFNPDTPERIPADSAERAAAARARGGGLTVQVNGPFWQLREWCGFEGLCMLCIENPEFVEEMAAFWTDFVSCVLARFFAAGGELLRLGISEDMAYKAHSMISPAMTRRFLMPSYVQWVAQVKAAGCPIVDMDSDGCIEELIPIWIESGINVCDPIEVAAYNDIVEFRRRFGKQIGYTGGVDKRAMAAGGEVMRAELARIAPVVKDGGYIPGCDHGVPPDISWPNFIDYSRELAKMCGWT
ncbi:MAG: Uroporphyrinogen decarboxylase (URO-D) [bacterium ADurb.Bin429]|nr:MAG: Uroporphyrinogen decarboxylase (URO-D) [bacterium ADurb.Bin429]